jgi:hypothetical protein
MISDILLEEVGRALLLQIKGSLGQKLIDVAAEKIAEDAAFFAQLGQPVPETPLVMPPDPNWFEGHFPTLLEWDLSFFPNVTVMCYDESNQPADPYQTDQGAVTGYTAYVELFCESQDVAQCNRMAKRYATALHRAVTDDATLGGLVSPIDKPPAAQVSNSSARHASQEVNELHYVQGCRVEYVFTVPQPFWD